MIRKWQPIETAPHMRKVIVFYVNACGKGRTVMACYFLAKTLEMDDETGVDGDWDEATLTDYAPEGWYEQHEGDSPLMPLEEQPTHWMELPQPPATAACYTSRVCCRCQERHTEGTCCAHPAIAAPSGAVRGTHSEYPRCRCGHSSLAHVVVGIAPRCHLCPCAEFVAPPADEPTPSGEEE